LKTLTDAKFRHWSAFKDTSKKKEGGSIWLAAVHFSDVHLLSVYERRPLHYKILHRKGRGQGARLRVVTGNSICHPTKVCKFFGLDGKVAPVGHNRFMICEQLRHDLIAVRIRFMYTKVGHQKRQSHLRTVLGQKDRGVLWSVPVRGRTTLILRALFREGTVELLQDSDPTDPFELVHVCIHVD
jgi:hypothetical protein